MLLKIESRGLTLLEVIFSLSIIVFIIAAVMMVYVMAMKGSSQTNTRNDLRQELQVCFDKFSNDLKRGKAVSVAAHSIRFTVNESGVDQNYIFYLYSPSDLWPPNFNQSKYDLKKAGLTGGLNGTFSYGSGEVLCVQLNPPASPSCGVQNTCISAGTKSVTINLAKSKDSETISMQNSVRLRNV